MLDRRAPSVASPKLSPVNPLRLALLALALLFWAAPVLAATVAIVRPSDSSPELTEMLFRLHGELLSVGLEVEIADRPPSRGPGPADPQAWLEKIAAERGARAVIVIVGDKLPVAVDVWVLGQTPQRFKVSRVSLEPDTKNASERLAIRATEVLRSSLIELGLAARERHDAPIAKPATTTLPQGEVTMSRPERFGLEAGAVALTSLDRVGPAILPMVRFDFAARPWLVVQASLAGLGSRPTVATTAASARVTQQYGVLGGCYRFRSDQRLRPFLALSAGVLHTSVEGQADPPKQGHRVTQWSSLWEGSLGAELRLLGPYHLTLATHVQMAAPYVAIHFADAVVATSGRPNLLLTLTLGAWL